MHRWTNDFPWRFMQPSFLDQGEELRKFIAEAKPENQWPHSILLPRLQNSEYGVVLIDFPSRELLSQQGYCTPGSMIYSPGISSADKEECSAIIELIKRKQIDRIERLLFRGGEGKTESTVEQFLSEVRNKKSRCLWIVYLSPSVFKLTLHSCERPKTLTAAKKWMKDRGWNP